MTFQFENLQSFLTMSGHGPYVWSCYLVTFLALAYLFCAPILKRRSLMTELKRKARIAKHDMRQQAS